MKEIVAIAIDLLTAPFRKDTVTDVVKVLEGQVDKLFKISADRIATASTLRDKADVMNWTLNELACNITPNLRLDLIASAQAELVRADTME